MRIRKEDLTIQCPCCEKNKKHTYTLEIEVSMVIYNISLFSKPSGKYRSFTRLFNCPLTGEKFQAGFRLYENSSAKIIDVKVGVVQNE